VGVSVGLAAAEPAKPVSADNTNKKAKEAKVVKVDGKKHTVTVKMQVDGKEVEKTFKLADNIEYADSTGKVAAIEIFTSGDMVLMVEEEGMVSKLKKCDKSEKNPNSK
jgi:uncharacterized protein YuzE